MNKRIITELKKELAYIEAGSEADKHIYAMERLLGLLKDTGSELKSDPKLEDNVTIHHTPVAKPAVDEDDVGNGRDIFDF